VSFLKTTNFYDYGIKEGFERGLLAYLKEIVGCHERFSYVTCLRVVHVIGVSFVVVWLGELSWLQKKEKKEN
jgi:hypothetical protein